MIHLFLALVLFSTGHERRFLARSSTWLAAGLLLLVSGGLYQSFLALYSGQQQSWGLSLCWIWSSLLIGAAALAYLTAAQESTENEQPDAAERADAAGQPDAARWRAYVLIALPYAATLCVCVFLVWFEYAQGRTAELARLAPLLLLLLTIMTRQMVAMRDNLRLSQGLHDANSQLALSNRNLGRNVEERTRHLATLHGITSTLNTSLDRRTVLRVTLEKTMMAVGANCGGIWLRTSKDDGAAALPGLTPGETSALDGVYWTMVHSHGFDGDDALQTVLRDLAVAAAAEDSPFLRASAPHVAAQAGVTPPAEALILVPIRWQSSLMGVMALLRRHGEFSSEDRALVESVALEAGTSLQNARLYYDARHRADRDSVTSLLNHRAVQESLNELLRQARTDGGRFSIVMMDLNNFKFFNDTYGHPIGDEVLRTVAHCLREVCRAEDLLGRYGGDEFIALLPDTDENGARNVCRRISASLDQHHFEAEPGSRIPINVAFGWAAFPQDGDAALDLLTSADSSLYENKRSGGALALPQQAEITSEVRDEMRRLKSRATGGSFGVLDALVTAIDNKDHYTRRHSEEVTHMALLIARELNYEEDVLRAVRISGLLHDVGKIAVPDDVLRHPGRLTDEQWSIMKQHPVFGALIVKDLPHLDEVLGGVRHHHERWDGKGYPDALEGEAIPTLGRLLAVPDCYSAMTTDRPYRKGFTAQAALAEIEKSIGTQFDPVIASAFLRVMRRGLSVSPETPVRQSTPAQDEIDPARLPARASSV
jgi:diguanylate cyclase (GGDEF)-like protein/putative nucleotidyltransferase with HDIG domain